jgi:hypothetical protein
MVFHLIRWLALPIKHCPFRADPDLQTWNTSGVHHDSVSLGDPPSQPALQEVSDVIWFHGLELSDGNVIEELRCEWNGVADNNFVSGLFGTSWTCFDGRSENVRHTDESRFSGQICCCGHSALGVLEDEVGDCEGSVEGESEKTSC